MEKLYPSASYSLGHEAWMLWWPLMVARILTIFQSKVFVMSLSLSQAQSLSSVPTWQFFTYDSIKNHDFALVNPSIVPTAAWKHG